MSHASDAFLLLGFGLLAAAGFLVAVPAGLAVTGVEAVAVGYLIERRAMLGVLVDLPARSENR